MLAFPATQHVPADCASVYESAAYQGAPPSREMKQDLKFPLGLSTSLSISKGVCIIGNFRDNEEELIPCMEQLTSICQYTTRIA